VKYKGKECIMLASNNYLGLNTHPKVIAAAKKALDKYGAGNCASRLVVNLDLYEKLEKEIAKYKKCSSAMLYSSGYAANLGIISSIAGKNDVILSDELNHASIIDGCRLSRAKILVYNHNDINHLEKLLKKIKNKKTLVVTDSVFSMDGDTAPLRGIINLKKEYLFKLMIDDAHATGIINTNFKGIDIHMGTLSKSLGSQGGYVAGSRELIDYLRNFSRTFFFSTGLSPANTGAAIASFKIIKKDKSLRDKLLINSSYLRKGLDGLGFEVKGNLQIIPLIIGDIKKTMQFQKMLEKDGIFVTGIRPPTVKIARLRISVMATHTRKQLDKALESFGRIGRKLRLIQSLRVRK
jgi:glycine C-acetyltransferase/8-amino-7-oxononanoate synthase|tara:strand:+ start:6250 stop:7302 length:1053 start_codon:yes stop_codon:yes gene_type:complete